IHSTMPRARSKRWRLAGRSGGVRSAPLPGALPAPGDRRLDPKQTTETRYLLGIAGKPQRMPSHGVVARGHRLAEPRLGTIDQRGHAQAGAGDEDSVDRLVATELDDRRFERWGRYSRHLVVVAVVERAHGRDRNSTRLDV